MRFQLFSSIVLASTALASPIALRDAKSITDSITTISSSIITLNNTLNNFHDGFGAAFTAIKIQLQTGQLSKDIQAATTAAQQSQPLSSSDSFTVGLTTLNLETSIFSLLNNLVSKKPVFDEAILGFISLSNTVKSDLESQKGLSAAFGDALISRLDPSVQGLAGPVNAAIGAAFDKAIAAYAVPGGLFEPPAIPSLPFGL
jgi:hypothetical protein